jgi:hypothetical protein
MLHTIEKQLTTMNQSAHRAPHETQKIVSNITVLFIGITKERGEEKEIK